MIRFLKRSVKAMAARCGVVIFKRSTGLYLPEDEMPLLVQRLCGKTTPVIVNGGAHRGDFVLAIRRVLPGASFICFEPTPDLVKDLRAMFVDDPRVAVVAAALGEVAGTAKFHLNAWRATSFLLPSAGQTAGALGALVATETLVEVEVTTIDAALAKLIRHEVDIIKLDLQGYDFRALLGAAHALMHASMVVVGAWFAPIYKGAADYLRVWALMSERGFALFALTILHFGSTHRLLWGDAVFLPPGSAAWVTPIAN